MTLKDKLCLNTWPDLIVVIILYEIFVSHILSSLSTYLSELRACNTIQYVVKISLFCENLSLHPCLDPLLDALFSDLYNQYDGQFSGLR